MVMQNMCFISSGEATGGPLNCGPPIRNQSFSNNLIINNNNNNCLITLKLYKCIYKELLNAIHQIRLSKIKVKYDSSVSVTSARFTT